MKRNTEGYTERGTGNSLTEISSGAVCGTSFCDLSVTFREGFRVLLKKYAYLIA
jgi:hypothetical protein